MASCRVDQKTEEELAGASVDQKAEEEADILSKQGEVRGFGSLSLEEKRHELEIDSTKLTDGVARMFAKEMLESAVLSTEREHGQETMAATLSSTLADETISDSVSDSITCNSKTAPVGSSYNLRGRTTSKITNIDENRSRSASLSKSRKNKRVKFVFQKHSNIKSGICINEARNKRVSANITRTKKMRKDKLMKLRLTENSGNSCPSPIPKEVPSIRVCPVEGLPDQSAKKIHESCPLMDSEVSEKPVKFVEVKVNSKRVVNFFLVNLVENQKLNQTTAELPFG